MLSGGYKFMSEKYIFQIPPNKMKSYFFILTFSVSILLFVSCDHDEVGLISDPYDPELPQDSGIFPRPGIPKIEFKSIEFEGSITEITSMSYGLIQSNFQSPSIEELVVFDSIKFHLEVLLESDEIENWKLKGDSLLDFIHNEDAEFTETSKKMNDLFLGDDWLKNYLIIIKPAEFESFEVEALVQGDSLHSLVYIDTTGSDCATVWYEWGLRQVEPYLKLYSSQKKVIDSVFQIRSVELSVHKHALADSIHLDFQYHIDQAINYWVSLDTKLKDLENTDPTLHTALSAFNNTLLASNYFRIKNLRESTLEQLELEYEIRSQELEVKYLNLVYLEQGKFNQAMKLINETMQENAEDC